MYTMGVNGDITSQRSCRVGLPAGTYYVKVKDGFYHSNVNYNLRVNYVAADFWEREDFMREMPFLTSVHTDAGNGIFLLTLSFVNFPPLILENPVK